MLNLHTDGLAWQAKSSKATAVAPNEACPTATIKSFLYARKVAICPHMGQHCHRSTIEFAIQCLLYKRHVPYVSHVVMLVQRHKDKQK